MRLPGLKRDGALVWWALLGIFALNAILKWRFFSGLTQADDFSYVVYAFSLFRIPLPWDMAIDFRLFRMALIFPVALLFRVFPPKELVALACPMFASFATIGLTFLIGRRLYGVAAGLFAAFALATFPGDVVYGTMLLPDVLAPFYMALSVWAFLAAEDSKNRSMWWYFAAGVAAFLAFNSRENSYYFALFFLPFAFSAARWKRGLWMTGAGFLLPLVLLYGLYAAKTGDFLYNLHLAETQRDPLIASGYIPPNSVNRFTCFYYMFPLFREIPGRETQFASSLFGFTFYLGVPFLLYSAVRGWISRDRRWLVAPWWFLLGYAYIEFGSVSFTSYQIMLKLPRFLLTVTPALALGYGVVLADAFGFGWRAPATVQIAAKDGRKPKAAEKPAPVKSRLPWYLPVTATLAVLAMAFVLFTSYRTMARQHDAINANMRPYRWANGILQNRARKPIYGTGGWWNNKLSFYMMPDIRFADMSWHRSSMLRDLKAVKDPAELRDAYIVLDRTNFSGQNDLRVKHDYADFGSWALLPPKEWKLLGAEYGTEIYEVPADWTYTEPDSRTLARESLLFAAKAKDFMLFYSNLHPDFLAKLTEDQFWGLFGIMGDEKEPKRSMLLNSYLEYRDFNGKTKIYFNLEHAGGAAR